jgi:PIN domain nuclease of toxin-antitoxin system
MIWALDQPARLSSKLRDELNNPADAPFFSTISIWEIAIKAARHNSFAVSPKIIRDALIRAGWKELPFSGEHALAVGDLPRLHGDPFDRGLIAQAITEKTHLVTADSMLADYGAAVRVVKVSST